MERTTVGTSLYLAAWLRKHTGKMTCSLIALTSVLLVNQSRTLFVLKHQKCVSGDSASLILRSVGRHGGSKLENETCPYIPSSSQLSS